MKALTLWQPWASLIAIGVKTIETRSWAAPKSLIGQRIAIHAAKRPSDTEADFRFEPVLHEHGMCFVDLPLGAVLSTSLLVDCLPMIDANDPIPMLGGFVYVDPDFIQIHADADDSAPTYIEDQLAYGDFRSGRWAWLLDDNEQLDKPLPATGRQGMWDIYI